MKLSSTLVAGCLLVGAGPAFAHFNLVYPPSSTTQNALGDPQKQPPCGGSARTNVVTKVKAGEVITLKWSETIPHPGHFRISITDGAPSVFVDPVVTGANCGSAAIEANPTMPTLMDGVHVHNGSGTKTWEQQITIPNMSCDKCTLQVLQFMSAHGEPCFYYHCAELQITADTGPGDGGASDGGVRDGSAPDASTGSGGAPGTGGSTGSGGNPGSGGAVASGSGGTTSGRGGSGGGSSSRGGASGGSAPNPSSGDSGGCSVSRRGDGAPGGGLIIAGLGVGLAVWARRRRPSRHAH